MGKRATSKFGCAVEILGETSTAVSGTQRVCAVGNVVGNCRSSSSSDSWRVRFRIAPGRK